MEINTLEWKNTEHSWARRPALWSHLSYWLTGWVQGKSPLFPEASFSPSVKGSRHTSRTHGESTLHMSPPGWLTHTSIPKTTMPLMNFHKIQQHVIPVNPASTRLGRKNTAQKNTGKKNMIALQNKSLTKLRPRAFLRWIRYNCHSWEFTVAPSESSLFSAWITS